MNLGLSVNSEEVFLGIPASKVKKQSSKTELCQKKIYFVGHRIYSWQVAPQQSLLPLSPASKYIY